MHIAGWILFAAGAVVLVFAATEILLRLLASRLRPLSEWRNWEMQFKAAAVNDLSAEGGASVVAVGSSTVNAGVDPDLLSQLTERARPAFNAALNGAGMRLLELWTLRFVVPRLRPDVVVIGLGSGEVNSGNAVAKRLLDALLTSPAWGEVTPESPRGSRWIRWAEKRSFVFRYRGLLGKRALFQPDPRERASACRRLGLLRWFLVFRFRKYMIEDQQLRLWGEVLDDYDVDGEEIEALGRLIDGLRAAGVAPLLVRMPYTEDWIDIHPDGRPDFDRFQKALGAVARERDVSDVDLTTPFSSLEEFADPVHLNGEGQVRFTNLLADVIAHLPAPSRT